MFFSVVIPNYNRVEPLLRAIESVRAQSFGDWELLVIDDCSGEDIYCQIEDGVIKLADDRIHLVRHDTNLNGAAARNTGIQHAQGSFIAFLDSDDEWLPNKLANDYAVIEKRGTQLVYSPIVNCDQRAISDPIPLSPMGKEEKVCDYLFVRNKNGRGMQTSTLVVEASIAKRVCFNPKLKGHQDWDFVLRLAAEGINMGFASEVQTYRHRSEDGDHVHSRLDLAYSENFLHQYRPYFTNKAIQYYVTRILLPKAVYEYGGMKVLSLWVKYKIGITDAAFVIKQMLKSLLLALKRRERSVG